MKYPKRVKRLEAKDICRRELDGPNGTHCLLGWMYSEARDFISQANNAVRAQTRNSRVGIARFNDNPKRTNRDIAAVWNRAMKSLGYKLAKNGKYFYMPKKKVA